MTSPQTEANGAQLVNAATAILSMRNSSFDELSAYGEVIDNSIQADASFVKMKFETTNKQIRKLVFGDDGKGMDAHTLQHCLSLGWSSRYNDREGIGRFGVGMKLGAIHQCKRIEVWSKQAGGEWLHTYLDLDEIEAETMTLIPVPVQQNPPSEFSSLVGSEHGTLIVWSKYDNLRKRLLQLHSDLKFWAGRTFRYFMWNETSTGEPIPNRSHPLTIYVDGEEIKAIDPLYHNRNRTRFPDDPQATLFDDIILTWPVDRYGLAPGEAPEHSDIRIRFSLLPEEFRQKIGASANSIASAERNITKQSNGISIVRNHREVWWGPIPHWNRYKPGGWSRFVDLDRWWGCEIQFDAWLDRAFAVKNIKDGAIPLPELMESIKKNIMPSQKTATEEIQGTFAKTKARERSESARADAAEEMRRRHGEAERVARLTSGPEPQLGKDIDPDDALDEFIKDRDNYATEESQAAIRSLFESQPFTIEETEWRGSKFFDASHMGGRAILEYNMNHLFFDRINELLEILESGGEEVDSVEIGHELKVLIDLLIISYARAESNFADETMMKAKDFIDNMRNYWGQFLLNYINTRESDS
jgi:hypothetical protein